MRFASFIVLLAVTPLVLAADLKALRPNTWTEIKYATVQPAGADQKGRYSSQGWNKLVYDPDGKRALIYDRWVDKKHGGTTIYGNCLFGLDPAAGKLAPIKIDNWTKKDTKTGGYRTHPLPGNDDEPTPCPRHVYRAFDYVPDQKAVYICNGANQSAVDKDGKYRGHDLCDGAWRLDLKTKKWSRIKAEGGPRNHLDDAMAYCPPTGTIIYAGYNRQLWVLDLKKGAWRKAKNSPPARAAMGQTIVYDPSSKRMLIAGGGRLDAWQKGKAPEYRELYAFDPVKETVKRLADAPTALYAASLAYDSKRALFFTVAVFDKKEQPSGMYCYDPKKDAWREAKPANAVPPHKSWFGWMLLCYDSHNDCLIGKVRDRFYAFRYAPAK